jgi:hypothetical protein
MKYIINIECSNVVISLYHQCLRCALFLPAEYGWLVFSVACGCRWGNDLLFFRASWFSYFVVPVCICDLLFHLMGSSQCLSYVPGLCASGECCCVFWDITPYSPLIGNGQHGVISHKIELFEIVYGDFSFEHEQWKVVVFLVVTPSSLVHSYEPITFVMRVTKWAIRLGVEPHDQTSIAVRQIRFFFIMGECILLRV